MKISLKLLVVLFFFFISTTSLLAQDLTHLEALKGSPNYGKSVAVFGGSVSVIPPSDSAKVMWEKYLNLKITNFGVPGAGFSSLQGKSLQQQVDEAGVFDIYVLWASTNDYTNKREIGEYTDYTEFDGFNEQKLTTQAGGINYCIKKIYEKNPDAIIYFFTSSKAFINRASFDPFVENGMVQYVDMQKKICALHGVPVLDQFEVAGFNTYNQSKFYRDPIHINYLGYQKLGELQVSFLAFPK